MNVAQTLINTFVVSAVGVMLAAMVSGVRRDLRELRVEFKADLGALRAELKADIAELRAELHEEIRAVRSDLTQVALALGARLRAQGE